MCVCGGGRLTGLNKNSQFSCDRSERLNICASLSLRYRVEQKHQLLETFDHGGAAVIQVSAQRECFGLCGTRA